MIDANKWVMDYNSDTVKHFGYSGMVELDVEYIKQDDGTWGWSGRTSAFGECYEMNDDELNQAVKEISRKFQSVL